MQGMSLSQRMDLQRSSRLTKYQSLLSALLSCPRITYWQGSPKCTITSTDLTLKNNNREGKLTPNTRHLAMLGIPLEISPFELLEECLSGYTKHLAQIKIVRLEYLSYYAILLEFSASEPCQGFYKEYSGSHFSEFDDEVIVLREVESVQVDYAELSLFAFLANQLDLRPFSRLDSQYIFQAQTLQAMALNRPLQCSICSQHCLNSSEPIITTICLHVFHASCLKKHQQKQSNCPNCGDLLLPKKLVFCEQCCQYEDIWLCLVCFKRLCSPSPECRSSHTSCHHKLTSHDSFLSIDTLQHYSFNTVPIAPSTPSTTTTTPIIPINPPRMKKKEFLRECIRMENQRIKQQMAVEDRFFEAELVRIPKEYEQRMGKLLEQYMGLRRECDSINTQELQDADEKELKRMEAELEIQSKVRKLLAERLEQMVADLNVKTCEVTQLEAKVRAAKIKIKELEMKKNKTAEARATASP